MSRSIRRLTSHGAVLAALRLHDELGAPEFLRRHGFGKSYRYQLVHNGREYDSKAVAGVAYGFQHPNEGALRSSEFSGGTSGAVYVLQRLGFGIQSQSPGAIATGSPRHCVAPAAAVASPAASTDPASAEVDLAIAVLADVDSAWSPLGFPWARQDLATAGLYAWYIDAEGARTLSHALGEELRPGLVYAGQAGATAWPSGTKRSSSLLSRVGGNHLRGGIRSSTWRLTLAALLVDPLDLEVAGRDLTSAGHARLTSWMHAHLRLNLHPVEDRDLLGALEHQVLARLDPPLNLDGMKRTAVRVEVSRRRAQLSLTGPAT